MAEKRYSEDAAREILKRASDVQLKESDFSDSHLEQMAQELGISENALVLAKEQYLAEQAQPPTATPVDATADDDLSGLGITPQIRQQYELHRKREFLSHLAVYGVMGIFFFLINLFSSPESWWFFWPMLGWGIGVAIHAINTYVTVLDKDDYEDELIKWHTKRVKRRRKLVDKRRALEE